MTFTKLGVVLPVGASGDFDDNWVYAGSALARAKEVWLYYTANDRSKFRIGLATSGDGLNFVRHGVVLPVGKSGDFDDAAVQYPAALERDGKIYLYYVGNDGSKFRIGLATSKDGIHFVRHGVVLSLGEGGDFDDALLDYLTVLEREGMVWMYYSAFDGSNLRIGLATSKDGIHFVRHGVVLSVGEGGDFDDTHVFFPAVLERGERIYLYYFGYHGTYRIGLAVSKDGVHFVRMGVVLTPGVGGDFDGTLLVYPAVLKRDEMVWLYYTALDGGKDRVGLAISEDGL